MGQKINKFVYWSPRILAIIFILSLTVFSLDVFEEDYDFWGTILGLFMHNIPSIVLLIVLIISWRREIVGGIAFIIGGILYIAILLMAAIRNGFEWYYLLWTIQISGIAFFIGTMFLVCWSKKKK